MTINRNEHFLEKSFDVSVRNTVRHFSNHHFAKEMTTQDWIDAGSKLPSTVWVEILELAALVDCDHSSAFIAHVPVENL